MTFPPDLLDGYGRFRRERFAEAADRYRALAAGQKPKTMIIACADSRVDPATIFSAAPGELFVVRNVAALVPPCEENGKYHGTSAALEFAVSVLQVESIVVMGHERCGGIAAALAAADNRPVGRFIRPWVDILSQITEEALDRTDPERPGMPERTLERMAIKKSLENLATFPFVTEAIAAGRLKLDGAWFSIAAGELHVLDNATGRFEVIRATGGEP